MDSGLAGLVAAETVLSHSDGARGILWVRGHTLPDLAKDMLSEIYRTGNYKPK